MERCPPWYVKTGSYRHAVFLYEECYNPICSQTFANKTGLLLQFYCYNIRECYYTFLFKASYKTYFATPFAWHVYIIYPQVPLPFLCTCPDDFLVYSYCCHVCIFFSNTGNTGGSDQVPPVITYCPANQPENAPIYASSGQTATYNFPDAQATDVNDLGQSTTPVILYTIHAASPQTSQESTGQFPIGTTYVTITATDGSSNQASCLFTVTVTETTGKTYSILFIINYYSY